MTNKVRYFIVMAICVAMNFGFNFLAVTFNLPLWLDVTGTATAAFILEPAAGLIVGLINNFYLAIFEFNASSLIYYAVSAAVALIVGINMRRQNKTILHRVLTTIILVIVVSALLSTLLTMWRAGGLPTAEWEIYYYNMALAWGLPNIVSCFFGTFVIKVYDTLAVALIVAIVYGIMPRALKFPPKNE